MSLAARAATPAVTLESHGVTLSLDGTPDLDHFVSQANTRAHIKGLADRLNPGTIDAGKLRAMVAALPAQPESVRTALAGHTLIVGASGFGILAVEPASADAFGAGYRLMIEREAGVHVLAHAEIAMDPELAKQLSTEAHAAVTAAHKAVLASEKGHKDPDGLDTGDLRWRRSRAATGWLIAAKGWLAAAPGDAAATKAVADARAAAKSYDMPSGGRI